MLYSSPIVPLNFYNMCFSFFLPGEAYNFQWYKPPFDKKLGTHRNVQLYNIIKDPEEKHDLFHLHPEKVKELLLKLAVYNKTAVPVSFPPDDHNWDPSKNGDGVIRPWL